MTGPLKVVMATTSYPRWDGDFAGHFVASLAEEIASRGNTVTVVAPHAADAATDEERRGVRVRRARYGPDASERVAYGDGVLANLKRHPTSALRIPSLARALSREVGAAVADADVLHVHWAPTSRLVAAARQPIPVVLTLHGSDVAAARRSAPFRALLRYALQHAHGVATVAGEQAAYAREAFGFSGPLEVIPSGVPLELLERPREPRVAAGPFTFGFVGRLIPGKGPADLIEAFARASEGERTLRLVIAGKGPLEPALKARAAQLGLADAISFLGEVTHDRALEVMQGADALVLPSYGEGSPLSVTEAMALGTPVIATPVGAVPELVADTGELVTPGDVEGLGAVLSAWADAPDATLARGVAARKHISAHYAWGTIAERTLDLYRAAIARAAHGK